MTDKQFIRELKEIIAQEVRKKKLDTVQPDDYTVEKMMKDAGLSIGQARNLLNTLADQGYFIKVRVPNPNGGGARIAYRPVENKKG